MKNTAKLSCALFTALILTVTPSQAALFNYTLTGTFNNSTFPAAIDVGDTFQLTFTLDYSALDSPQPPFFSGALSDLTFALTSGSGYTGTITGYDSVFVGDNILGGIQDQFSYSITSSTSLNNPPFRNISSLSFPALDGSAFQSFGVQIYTDPSVFSIPGSTTSFGSAINNQFIDESQFSTNPSGFETFISIQAANSSFHATATISNVTATAVPEPSTAFFGVVGLAVIFFRRFRNNRNV